MKMTIILICFLFFTVSFLIGNLINCLCFPKSQTIFLDIFSGIITIWGLLEALLVPMTFCKVPFHTLSQVYGCLLITSCIGSFFFWRRLQESISDLFKNWKKYISWTTVIAIIIILLQLCYLYKYTYYEWDDNFYVGQATEALKYDIISGGDPETGRGGDFFSVHYVFSLWSIFYALLANWFQTSPTIIAHTVLPFIIIPFGYLIYLLMGQLLFKKDTEAQGYFLIFTAFMHMFIPNLRQLGSSYFLVAPWMGKTILATVSFPAVLYLMFRLTQEKCCFGDWVLLFLNAICACLFSSMAIMFIPTLACSFSMLWSIKIKKPSFFLKTIISCIPCLLLGICALIL